MKYTVSFLNRRAEFVLNELGANAKVLEQDDKYTTLEITITSTFDLLGLFHAGVHAGMK